MRHLHRLPALIVAALTTPAFASQQCILPEPYLQGGPEGYANHLIGQVQQSGTESAPAGSHWVLERVDLPCDPEEWGAPLARVQPQHGSIRVWNVRDWTDDEGRTWRQTFDHVLSFKASRVVWLTAGQKLNLDARIRAQISGKAPPGAPDRTEEHAALVPQDQNPIHYFWDPSRESLPGSGGRSTKGEAFVVLPGGPEGIAERMEVLVQLGSSTLAGYREVRYGYRWVER